MGTRSLTSQSPTQQSHQSILLCQVHCSCYSTLLHHSTPLALDCIVHCIALYSLTARFPSKALKTAVSSVESMVSWVGTCPNQQLGTCLNQLWRVEFCSVESLTFSWWSTWFCALLIGSNFQTRHLLLQISVSVFLFLIPLSLLPKKKLHETDFGGWICSTAKAGRPLRHAG